MKKYLSICLLFLFSFLNIAQAMPDEGMYPLSEIKKLDLKKAGLKIPQAEVYNPNGLSLIDALVNVGGCTGSFVSNEGLIITNHHCAFEAVSLASTPEHDYLKNGFVAATKEQEVQAKNLTCKITDSYEDVSEKVLSAVKNIFDPTARINAINAKIAQIIKEEEQKDATIKAEVSEMFIGRTYVLFRYKTIKDVRIVYVPQRAVGEFGGESDNWVWPRHTGDFSFLRAYVAKDGSSATYSKDNVPYQPKKYLKVNPNGANEGDFVFILGYPGRTFRNYPAKYIQYQEKFQLPYISNLYDWQNKQMEATSINKTLELKQASKIKRKANVLKNYRGKLKGLKGIDLVNQKFDQEKELQEFINADTSLIRQYSKMLQNIDMVYEEVFADAQKFLVLDQVLASSNALSIANQVVALQKKIAESPIENQEKVYQDGKTVLLKSARDIYDTYVETTDKLLLKRILLDGLTLESKQQFNLINGISIAKGTDWDALLTKHIDHIFAKSDFAVAQNIEQILNQSFKNFLKYKDPMMALAIQARTEIDQMNAIRKDRNGRLNKLLADYVNVSILFKKSDFIPDANSTLRLTYGNVKGFTPVDATYMKPTTTLTGLIEKGTSEGDYYLPSIFKELKQQKDFGQFTTKDGKDVPVAFLYNLDTTGGNSGSPIMDENGNLVGVNFDRAYEATINDFAWNDAYSRSIGCDIRYVLWVAQKVDHADFILTELGVKTIK
ncbi:MAG: hypothetical protein RI952_1142 [Bacteroidota bacterium]|jgi:hypothetical protein